ncbi:MAG: amino acid racemase [Trueperaceae bacterium]|nr:amino acid racemase [Trueperaceae bacterium]
MIPAADPARVTVGVIGGMGPAATWAFGEAVLAATPAATEQGHLRLLVDADPAIPDRNAAMAGEGPSPAPILAAKGAALRDAGADLVCMPCVTAHAFADPLRAAVGDAWVDAVEASADAVRAAAPAAGRVGVIATTSTWRAGHVPGALAGRGLAVVDAPEDERAAWMDLIYAVKGGRYGAAERAAARALAARSVAAGAEVLLAACTEVPLLLRDGDAAVPVVAASEALAAAVVARAGAR